jgi:aminomethyltransferase
VSQSSPDVAAGVGSPVKATPFFERAAAISNTRKCCHWAPFVVVDTFTSVEQEVRALRTGVVVADQSPLVHTIVKGPDAGRLIDHIATRDCSGLQVDQAYYTAFTDHDGKMVCDAPVERTAEDAYAISTGELRAWVLANADGYDVEVTEETAADRGLLCPQGPKAREVLEAAVGRDCGDVRFSRRTVLEIAGVEVSVLRQGFTGELGYELYVPAEAGPAVWDAIWAAGEPHGISGLGNAGIIVARVEAGLVLVERDYNPADPAGDVSVFKLDAEEDAHVVSPYEIDLDRFVDLDKPSFVGRDALAAEQAAGGTRRRFVGLEYDVEAMRRLAADALYDADAGVAFPDFPELHTHQAMPLTVDGAPAGVATSFVWSPTLHRNVSFARVDTAHAALGSRVEVDVATNGGGSRRIPATVVDRIFVGDRRRG